MRILYIIVLRRFPALQRFLFRTPLILKRMSVWRLKVPESPAESSTFDESLFSDSFSEYRRNICRNFLTSIGFTRDTSVSIKDYSYDGFVDYLVLFIDSVIKGTSSETLAQVRSKIEAERQAKLLTPETTSFEFSSHTSTPIVPPKHPVGVVPGGRRRKI